MARKARAGGSGAGGAGTGATKRTRKGDAGGRRAAKPATDADGGWPFELRGGLGTRPVARLAEPPTGQPARRRLRVFAQDPTLHVDDAPLHVVSIPNEPLRPGPEGSLLVVMPVPEESPPQGLAPPVPAGRRRAAKPIRAMAEPVDLDAPALLMEQGLAPSSTRRPFMQQMVYAVCMETYDAFLRALGRDPGFGPLGGDSRRDGRLRVHPMAFRQHNAYYDRDTGTLKFGYGSAMRGARGRHQQGSQVYLALSRDIVAHEMSHALLDSLRPNFLRPTHRDIGALHEGFADVVALLMRFAQREAVERAIARTQGRLNDPLLMSIGAEFGFALISGTEALRNADAGDPYYRTLPVHKRYQRNKEEHDLGGVLLSAMFDALSTVFERDTAPIRTSLAEVRGRLPHEGVVWLAKQASQTAARFLDIAIRAIDYCPPLHCTFGEYLRAMITADRDLVGADGADYREILIASFRKFGITVPDVPTLSEDSLCWRPPQKPLTIDALRFERLGLQIRRGWCEWPEDGGKRARAAAEALGRAICTPGHAHDFGIARPDARTRKPTLLSLRSLRRVSPSGGVNFDLVAEVVQKRRVREGWFLGGSTIVISSEGQVRYAIAKHIDSARRLKDQREWLRRRGNEDYRDGAWNEHSIASARLLALHHGHRYGDGGR